MSSRSDKLARSRSVDCVVAPPPPGAGVFPTIGPAVVTTSIETGMPMSTKQNHSTTPFAAVSIFNSDENDPCNGSFSSISNVSSLNTSHDGMGSTETVSSSPHAGKGASSAASRRASLPNLQVAKPTSPTVVRSAMPVSYMKNFDNSITSFHEEEDHSSFSDLSASQDFFNSIGTLSMSRNSLANSMASLNTTTPEQLKPHHLQTNGAGLVAKQCPIDKQTDMVHASWRNEFANAYNSQSGSFAVLDASIGSLPSHWNDSSQSITNAMDGSLCDLMDLQKSHANETADETQSRSADNLSYASSLGQSSCGQNTYYSFKSNLQDSVEVALRKKPTLATLDPVSPDAPSSPSAPKDRSALSIRREAMIKMSSTRRLAQQRLRQKPLPIPEE